MRGRGRAVRLRLRDPARVLALPPGRRPGLRGVQLAGAVAVLAGQIVIAPLGGPLPGVAPGRRARFPGAAFVLFLVLSGWVNLVTALTIARPDSAPAAVLRLFSPFALFTLHSNAGVTAWRGSPWFFAGWQLALCALAVLAALLRGAGGRTRARIIRALGIAGVAALIMLVLAGPRVHPRRHRAMTGPAPRARTRQGPSSDHVRRTVPAVRAPVIAVSAVAESPWRLTVAARLVNSVRNSAPRRAGQALGTRR